MKLPTESEKPRRRYRRLLRSPMIEVKERIKAMQKIEAEEPLSTFSEAEIATAEAIDDPALFSDIFLGHDLWPKQRDILYSVATKPKTMVKACHASGKTFTAADAALWWLARYEDGVVVTTAPTDTQVRKLLWGDISAAVAGSKYPFPVPNQVELRINSKRYAIGFSTSVTQANQGVKFQGFHSGHILIIMDEAPGVHPGIWDAIEGIRAGGLVSVLGLGNPIINSGPFYDCFSTGREGINCITLSAFDTPNLFGLTIADLLKMEAECPHELDNNERPYLTTRRWVLDRYKEWGEDHPLYQSKVLGLFPEQSEYSLLSLAWLELAKLREIKTKELDPVHAGLDVAGPGEDETVLTIRCGSQILFTKSWAQEDPRGEVVAQLTAFKSRLKAVNVDCIGIGWGMYLHLRDIFGSCVVPVNVGAGSLDDEKYLNLKAELYWGLRMRLKAGDMGGLTDDKAIAQLAGLRYETNPRGQILIERKKDAVKRGVKSPDRAESIMLAFARPMKPGAGLMDWMSGEIAKTSEDAAKVDVSRYAGQE